MRYDIISLLCRLYKLSKQYNKEASNKFDENYNIQLPDFQDIKTNINGVTNLKKK